MFNAGGGITTTCEAEMAAYDLLPGKARKALQESVFDWAVQPIKTAWEVGKRGYRDGHAISRTIEKCDRDRIAAG